MHLWSSWVATDVPRPDVVKLQTLALLPGCPAVDAACSCRPPNGMIPSSSVLQIVHAFWEAVQMQCA